MKKLLFFGVVLILCVPVATVFILNDDHLTIVDAQPGWDTREDIYLQGGADGGCHMSGACPFFTLFQNGDFIHVSQQFNEDDAVKTYGTYKPNQFAKIKSGIEELDWDYLMQKTDSACWSWVDGPDTTYTLQDGTQISTCGMRFGEDTGAQSILGNAWPKIR